MWINIINIFNRPEAFFREYGLNIINIINISPVGGKKCFWPGKC